MPQSNRPRKRDQPDQTFLVEMDMGNDLPGGARMLLVACRPRDGHEFGQPGFEEGWVILVDPISLTQVGCCGIDVFERDAIPIALFHSDLPPGPERAPNLPWGRHA